MSILGFFFIYFFVFGDKRLYGFGLLKLIFFYCFFVVIYNVKNLFNEWLVVEIVVFLYFFFILLVNVIVELICFVVFNLLMDKSLFVVVFLEKFVFGLFL